jgi:hypothetical protein
MYNGCKLHNTPKQMHSTMNKKLTALTLALAVVCASSTPAVARSDFENALIGAAVMGVFMEARAIKQQQRQLEQPRAAVMYPVPVYQLQTVRVPTCTPNMPCPATIVVQCTALPVFDGYGNIIAYNQVCR